MLRRKDSSLTSFPTEPCPELIFWRISLSEVVAAVRSFAIVSSFQERDLTHASAGAENAHAVRTSDLWGGAKEALFRAAIGREPETWKLGKIAGAFRHPGASPFCCEPRGGLESPDPSTLADG